MASAALAATNAELKEEVRRATAPQVGCRFCASFGDPKDVYTDPREAVAVRLARTIADDPKKVDDALFAEVREHFDEEEWLEGFCRPIGQKIGATYGTTFEVYSLRWGGDED